MKRKYDPMSQDALEGLGRAFLVLAKMLEEKEVIDRHLLVDLLRLEAEPYIDDDGIWYGPGVVLRELSHIIEGDPCDWWKPSPELLHRAFRVIDGGAKPSEEEPRPE